MTVSITPATAVGFAFALLGSVALWGTLRAARSIIATAVAAGIIAILFSGPIEAAQRRMPRALAIPVLFLVSLGGLGGVGYAVYDDVDTAFELLQREAPSAAADLEASERFGEFATDLRLEERITDAVDSVRTSAQDRARSTAFRVVNYFVTIILAIFLLIYGSRIFDGFLRQFDEPRRQQLQAVATRSLETSRSYLLLELANAAVLGLATAVLFRFLDIPGASALGLLIAAGSVIPDLGVIVGAIPALLLVAASEPFTTFVVICFGMVALQAVESVFARRVLVRRLDVGPALTLLAVLIGYGIYGVGGAVFGVAIVVLANAALDAVGSLIDEQELIEAG